MYMSNPYLARRAYIFLQQKYLRVVLPFSIVFMQFTLFYYNTLPVNLALLSIILFLILFTPTSRLSGNTIVKYFSFVVFVSTYVFFVEDYIEYIKSYLQIIMLASVILLMYGNKKTIIENIPVSLQNIVFIGLLPAIIIIFQFVAWNVLDLNVFQAIFAEYSPRGPGGEVYKNIPGLVSRPNSLYSEPSIAGWMMAYLLACAWYLYELGRNKFTSKKSTLLVLIIIYFIAAIVTLSLSGIVAAFIVMLLIGYIYFHKKPYYIRLVSYSIILVMVGLAIHLATDSEYLSKRLERSLEPGTSIYYRFIAPVTLLNDSLYERPLGVPVGQTKHIETKNYMQNWDRGSNTNIDNSYFLVIYYFGIFGILAVILLIIKCAMIMNIYPSISPLIVGQLLILSATGALWSPWITQLLLFSLAVYSFEKYARIKQVSYA